MICLHGGMYGLSMCFYSFSALVCNGPSRKVQDDLPCMCPRSLTKIWATSVMGDHQVAMEKFTWMIWATSILGNIYIYMILTHYSYTYVDIRTHVYIIIYCMYIYIYINMHYTFFNFPDLWCKMIKVLWFAGALSLKANRTLYILYTNWTREPCDVTVWRSPVLSEYLEWILQ